MKHKNIQSYQEGSYTMIVSILIAFFLICLFIFRRDLFNGGKKEPNIFEQGTTTVEQAKQATQSQNTQTQEINQFIDN